MNALYLIMFVIIGGFSICGAYFNWDFFFESRKAKPLVAIFGRNGARIFYAILGAFIIFCGIMVMVTN